MYKTIIGAVALTVLAACGQQQQPTQAVEDAQQLRSGILVENMDTKVRPGDDFFSYVNGKWVADTEIPADKSSYSVFSSLNDEAQERVKQIIEESASGDFAKGSDEQKVGDLYKSFMDWDTRNAKGVAPLQPELDRIDAIATHDEVAVYFASAVMRGLDAPFAIAQFADLKDPKHYGIYMFQSGLGLPDREYYFNTDEKSKGLREQYVAHVQKMFELAGLDAPAEAAEAIMALETKLAEVNMKKEDTRDWAANYNKVAIADLPGIMPKFNWDGYIAEFKAPQVKEMIVIMTDYQKALDGIIQDTDLDTWKTYLRWSALNATASRLNEALDEQNFEFYGKALSGTEEQLPTWRRAVRAVNGNLGEVVGKVYVKRHFPPEAKERMLELVGNLIRAYEVSIKDLEWMSDETRVQALDKLSKFTPKIGYPDVWR
ncbi:MAG: M13 family metallopeptidase, partial [Gammaproteobacteria bacterium]|nr:M13 family metallopeptidase [Gammaproteobacteria bacterium]